MQVSIMQWLNPYENLVQNDDAGFIFEQENLATVQPEENGKKPSITQAKNHKINAMYLSGQYNNPEEHDHFYYQGDTVKFLGLDGERKSSDRMEPGNRRFEEWNQAFHFVAMIGGPHISDRLWYRRRLLEPRALGRWNNHF